MTRISVMHGDVAVLLQLKAVLEGGGHAVTVRQCVPSPEQGGLAAALRGADLVVVGRTPGRSGLELLGEVRARVPAHLPVLFLCEGGRPWDLARALALGADDAVKEMPEVRELCLRVSRLCRAGRGGSGPGGRRVHGRYALDTAARQIWLGGRRLALTPREYEVAEILFGHLDQVVPRSVLLGLVWQREDARASRSLCAYVHRLRRRLELCPENGLRLRTFYSEGYRLERVETADGGAGAEPGAAG